MNGNSIMVFVFIMSCGLFNFGFGYGAGQENKDIELKATECEVRAQERGFENAYLMENGECWAEYEHPTLDLTIRRPVTERNRYFNMTDLEAFKGHAAL